MQHPLSRRWNMAREPVRIIFFRGWMQNLARAIPLSNRGLALTCVCFFRTSILPSPRPSGAHRPRRGASKTSARSRREEQLHTSTGSCSTIHSASCQSTDPAHLLPRITVGLVRRRVLPIVDSHAAASGDDVLTRRQLANLCGRHSVCCPTWTCCPSCLSSLSGPAPEERISVPSGCVRTRARVHPGGACRVWRVLHQGRLAVHEPGVSAILQTAVALSQQGSSTC